MSKATATRRLAQLATQGLLTRHGSGRGTYYTVAQSISGAEAPANKHTLLSQLRERQAELTAGFDIISIEPIGAQHPHVRLDLRVRFATVPDLFAFFALERRIATALGVEVKLIPEA